LLLINPFQKHMILAWKERGCPEKELVKKQPLPKAAFSVALRLKSGAGGHTQLHPSGGLLALSSPIGSEALVRGRCTKEFIASSSPGKSPSNAVGPWRVPSATSAATQCRGPCPAPSLHRAVGKRSENLAHLLRSCSLIKLT